MVGATTINNEQFTIMMSTVPGKMKKLLLKHSFLVQYRHDD
jgi:hypothetical protein